jgi:hypothetical protein
MPVLYVIAGPNGAGKSSFSSTLLPDGLTAFDGDKELLLLQQKFPGTDTSLLAFYVNAKLFPTQKSGAAFILGWIPRLLWIQRTGHRRI